MTKDIVKERLDTIQEIIDRLIYLSDEDKDRYKRELGKLNEKYSINAVDIDGVRIINNKNYGGQAHV
jgi:hypothetical protein